MFNRESKSHPLGFLLVLLTSRRSYLPPMLKKRFLGILGGYLNLKMASWKLRCITHCVTGFAWSCPGWAHQTLTPRGRKRGREGERKGEGREVVVERKKKTIWRMWVFHFSYPKSKLAAVLTSRERLVWHVNVTVGKWEQPMATNLSMDHDPLLQKSSCFLKILSILPAWSLTEKAPGLVQPTA